MGKKGGQTEKSVGFRHFLVLATGRGCTSGGAVWRPSAGNPAVPWHYPQRRGRALPAPPRRCCGFKGLQIRPYLCPRAGRRAQPAGRPRGGRARNRRTGAPSKIGTEMSATMPFFRARRRAGRGREVREGRQRQMFPGAGGRGHQAARVRDFATLHRPPQPRPMKSGETPRPRRASPSLPTGGTLNCSQRKKFNKQRHQPPQHPKHSPPNRYGPLCGPIWGLPSARAGPFVTASIAWERLSLPSRMQQADAGADETAEARAAAEQAHPNPQPAAPAAAVAVARITSESPSCPHRGGLSRYGLDAVNSPRSRVGVSDSIRNIGSASAFSRDLTAWAVGSLSIFNAHKNNRFRQEATWHCRGGGIV